jgi:Zn-dependent protease
MRRLPLVSHARRGDDDGVIFRARLRLGRGQHVELGLHLYFLLTLVVVTSLLGQALLPTFFPDWAPRSYWLVAATVALIDSVAGLSHELGHAAAAIAKGRRVYRITLYGLAAAVRRSSGAVRPRDQVAIAVAGPLCHLLLASLLWAIWSMLPSDNQPLRVAIGLPALSNFVMGSINLLPLSPLDGGRAAQALVAALFPRLQERLSRRS